MRNMTKQPENQPENPVEGTEGEPSETTDLAGYETVEDLVAATYESRKHGKQLADRVRQLESIIQSGTASEKRAARRAVDEINDLGLPADTFVQAVGEVLDAVMDRKLAPMLKTNSAVANARTSNPDFGRFESSFNQWLADNPSVADQYNKAVADSPDSADLLLEGVFAQFSRSTATKAKAAAEHKTKKVPADAKIPATQGGSGSRKSEAGPSKEEVRDAILKARRTGDPVALMRTMLGDNPIHRDIERR